MATDGELVTLSGSTMGTRFSVRAAVPHGDVDELTARLQAVVDRVDAQMSSWKPDSIVSRFNTAPPGQWIDIPAQMSEVVRVGLEVGRISDGAFDMTLGRLVDLWGFGPAGRTETPSPRQVGEARAAAGQQHLLLRDDGAAICKTAPLALDLGGIAKGFGADELARVMLGAGIPDFVAEIAGGLRVGGSRPGGGAWCIAVALPVPRLRAAYAALSPGTMAVATSGDYRRFFAAGGRHLSHTIDGRTGAPVEGGLASATVLDPRCTRAAAIASALMVMG